MAKQTIGTLHPSRIVSGIIEGCSQSLILEFARYRYSPQTLRDERVVFSIPASGFGAEWLERTIASLGRDEELALHSRVLMPNGELRHIPMIDFAERASQEAISTELAKTLADYEVGDVLLYKSGRSYHGYGTKLIADSLWTAFMGSLLLSNHPTRAHLIDCRWIGHRLRAGYGSLRWSCNTSSYLQLPEYISTLSLQHNAE